MQQTIADASANMLFIHDETLATQYREIAEAQMKKEEEENANTPEKEEEKHPYESALKPFDEYDVAEVMAKRSNELTVHERAAKMMHLVGEQVNSMDDMIQKILATSEQDFLLAYKGQMTQVHK